MQKHRIISLASILAMLLIPAMGWLLVAQPQLAAATAADQQRLDVQSQIEASAAIVARLKADSADLPALNADLNDLRTSIPAGIDPSGYIDGLDALARVSGVTITGLTVSDAMAYAPAVPPVDPNAVAPDAAAAEDGASAPVPVPVENPAIVTDPRITGENFVVIPVSIEIAGEWDPILRFVQGLQSTSRLFLVTTMTTSRDSGSGEGMTAKLGGYIFAIPTGVEGKPRPTSTIVKQLEAPVPPPEDEIDATPDESPDATPTPTPAP